MAKKRFSLDETMDDAVQGIKEAQNTPVTSSKETKTEEEIPAENPEEKPISCSQEEDTSKANPAEPCTEEVAAEIEGIGKSLSDKNILKHKKKVNKTAVEKEARNVRNVYLSDETLECLEMIKKELNSSRKSKEEPFVSAANIMNLAIEEYIDRNFPDVRKLCQMIRQIKMKP